MTLKRVIAPVAASLLVIFLLPGCGGEKSRPRAKVHGTIQLDGKPLSEGSVQFTSTKTGEAAFTNLTPDGKYTLEFAQIDLATPYDVTVQAMVDENLDAIAQLEKPAEKKKSPIPRKYSDRTTSGLKAESIVAGDNEFNFELVSK